MPLYTWCMNLEITNLQINPELYDSTIKLIEKSFGYPENEKFDVDFYPLINKINWENCFLMVEGERVIAHIGVTKRKLRVEHNIFPVSFIGGIATDEEFRGKGIFAALFEKVLATLEDSTFQILWSDQKELYGKFGFYQTIEKFQLPQLNQSTDSYTKTKYSLLSENDKQQVQDIYREFMLQNYAHCVRTIHDWKNIEKINSSDLFIKYQSENILEYFFMNKGADLQDIIHEYASREKPVLEEMRSFGQLWLPEIDSENYKGEIHYDGLIRVCNTDQFQLFVQAYTEGMIEPIQLNQDKILFNFDGNEYDLDMPSFLCGIFGPGRFEELQGKVKPIFISGLDSI